MQSAVTYMYYMYTRYIYVQSRAYMHYMLDPA